MRNKNVYVRQCVVDWSLLLYPYDVYIKYI